jgi:hypothetical protein
MGPGMSLDCSFFPVALVLPIGPEAASSVMPDPGRLPRPLVCFWDVQFGITTEKRFSSDDWQITAK